MLIIGENIQILSPSVKQAIEERDAGFIQDLARRQVEAGAGVVDLNIGPQKKHGAEVMPWIVDAVQQVTDVTLSLDTTNLAAMEAGLQVCKRPAMLNSASADPARLDSVMQLAARYGARVIALTMGLDGIPTTTDGRAGIAMESLLPAAEAAGLPAGDVFLDPLVLTVTCNQDVAGVAIEAIRMFKMLSDPAPMTTVGLSNVSNGCPDAVRLADQPHVPGHAHGRRPGQRYRRPVRRAAEGVDTHRGAARRRHADRPPGAGPARRRAGTWSELEYGLIDQGDPEQVAVYKTYRMLTGAVIYADSYLNV